MYPFAHSRSLDTPVLLLDLGEVGRNVAALRGAFPGIEVWYAFKCNSHPRVAETVAALCDGFEVASLGEVRRLLALGVPPARMMCLHTVKSPAFLRFLSEVGVDTVAVDSADEVEKVARLAPRSRVVARIEVPNHGSRVPLGGKFGCTPDEAVGLLASARALGLEAAGITTHVGSQCEALDTWADALALCRGACGDLSARGMPARIVSLGGGFPVGYTPGVPTLPQIGRIVAAAAPHDFSPGGCRVTMEPGRAVVASAGTLVTSVVGTATRRGMRWVYLDAGTHHGMFEWLPAAGGMTTPIEVEHPNRPVVACRLAGPTCDSMDALPGTFELPDLRVGDRVAFRLAGAYSASISTAFNGFDPPAVVVVPDTFGVED